MPHMSWADACKHRACSPAQVLPESSQHCLAHSAFLVRAFVGLLLKIWCKMPDKLVKSVSSTKPCSLFIVQCESLMVVWHMGKLSWDLCLGRRRRNEVHSRFSAVCGIGASFFSAKSYAKCEVLAKCSAKGSLTCKDLTKSQRFKMMLREHVLWRVNKGQ